MPRYTLLNRRRQSSKGGDSFAISSQRCSATNLNITLYWIFLQVGKAVDGLGLCAMKEKKKTLPEPQYLHRHLKSKRIFEVANQSCQTHRADIWRAVLRIFLSTFFGFVSYFNPFAPKFKKYILPTFLKRNVWVR